MGYVMGKYAIIEIGSNNTKTHVYDNNALIYDKTTTIEFKKNYQLEGSVLKSDVELLFKEISKALEYTKDIHIYGCSIFRKLDEYELNSINDVLKEKFNVSIEVVSQEDEAKYTAKGCYDNIDYDGTLCVFIGGGGSVELMFVKNKEIIGSKFYDFGVVDITSKYDELKKDIPSVTYDEVMTYVNSLIGDIEYKADAIALCGGDHLYWFNNAEYKLDTNTIYRSEKQKFMLTTEKADIYDRDMMVSSLDAVRNRSDNPLWFDGSRAMRFIVNCITHKIDAKYIIPTNINMEDGIKSTLEK
jgi:hypothetical protein